MSTLIRRCPHCDEQVIWAYEEDGTLVVLDRQHSIEGSINLEVRAKLTVVHTALGPYRVHKCPTRSKKAPKRRRKVAAPAKQSELPLREREAIDELLEACGSRQDELPHWLLELLAAVRASRGYYM